MAESVRLELLEELLELQLKQVVQLVWRRLNDELKLK